MSGKRCNYQFLNYLIWPINTSIFAKSILSTFLRTWLFYFCKKVLNVSKINFIKNSRCLVSLLFHLYVFKINVYPTILHFSQIGFCNILVWHLNLLEDSRKSMVKSIKMLFRSPFKANDTRDVIFHHTNEIKSWKMVELKTHTVWSSSHLLQDTYYCGKVYN